MKKVGVNGRKFLARNDAVARETREMTRMTDPRDPLSCAASTQPTKRTTLSLRSILRQSYRRHGKRGYESDGIILGTSGDGPSR